MGLAVIKPDHVGDLVLSSAAIRAALARRPGTVLFVATGLIPIARVLFPGAEIRGIDFPHLSKSQASGGSYPDLRSFRHVMILRADGHLNPAWADLRCRDYSFPVDTHHHHQTIIDYGVAAPLLGAYDIDALHFGTHLPELERKARSEPRSVGLCIGSGFHANLWPAAHWLAMGRLLIERGRTVHVISGPAEGGLAAALASALGLAPGRVIQGGTDLAGFLDRVGALDRVIASDGGAGHLCGLRAPVVSVFGPSPFRRYAPYGRFNRLLTRDLSCSPCCQWAARLMNGCLSNECITAIAPLDVLKALSAIDPLPRVGFATTLRPGLSMYDGVSHLGLPGKLQERERHHDLIIQREEPPSHAVLGRVAKPVGRVPDAGHATASPRGADADGGGTRRRRRARAAAVAS